MAMGQGVSIQDMISIIVPIYNTEKYLNQCIQSILVQTYTNWELLLIDDGSKDKSGKICDEYAAKDSRIRVFHRENAGVSSARNIGLDNAIGKYIIFMDADDYWFEKTALAQLFGVAEKYNLDIIRGEYKAVDMEGLDLFQRPLTKAKINYSKKVLSSGLFYTKIMSGENFLVLSLFRRETIGALRLNKNRSFLEDMEFYANLLLQPLRCMFIPLRFYAYRKNENSVSYIPKVKNLIDSFSMTDVFNNCASKAKDEQLKRNYRYNSIMMYYWTLETLSQEPYYKDCLSIIEKLSLAEVNKRVRVWANSSMEIYPLPIYLSPILGIYYFRVRYKIGRLLRILRLR